MEFVNDICGAKGNWAPQYYPNQADPGAAMPIKVGRGQTVTGIDAELQPGSTITGRLTSRTGQPLRGVCVAALPPSEAYAFDGLYPPVRDTTSDRGGSYRIPDLAAGRYAVDFSACGSHPIVASRWFGSQPGAAIGDIVNIGTGVTASRISAVMTPGGGVSGTVRSSTAKPVISTCEVVSSMKAGGTAVEDYSFGASNYIVSGLPPGRYAVEFYTCLEGGNYAIQWFNRETSPRTASAVRVTANHVTRFVDAVMAIGGKISGRLTVKATGRPVRGYCVDASSASGTYFGFGMTGKNGDYVVRGLNTGTYRLRVSNCFGTAGAAAGQQLARTVRVTAPRTVTGVNAALSAGGSISGEVLAGSPPTGQGDVCVEADPVAAAGVGGTTTTGPGGRYVLPNLAPGRYRVYFDTRTYCDNSQDGLAPQWYDDATTRAKATIVTVTAGQNRRGADATLRADGGISGHVTAAASSAPLTGVCIRAVPRAAGRSASFTASASGSYSLTGLIPGAYTVRFSSDCGAAGYATQWWQDAASAAKATVITVRSGAVTTGISAALKS